MSRLSQVKCDQCGTVATPKAASAAGWRKITAMSVLEELNYRPLSGDFGDLCSWRCVMSYSADKANAEWLAASGTTVNAP